MSKCAYAECGKTINPHKRSDARFCNILCGERSRRKNPAFRDEVREYNRIAKRKERGVPEPTRPMPARCECCDKPRKLHADHDHKTGAFRGWLCPPCNTALGLLGDDLASLLRTRDYLQRA